MLIDAQNERLLSDHSGVLDAQASEVTHAPSCIAHEQLGQMAGTTAHMPFFEGYSQLDRSVQGLAGAGVPRLQTIVQNSRGSEHLIDECLSALSAFVGSDWEQEDDITLVMLQRLKRGGGEWHTLAEFAVLSEPGNERRAGE